MTVRKTLCGLMAFVSLALYCLWQLSVLSIDSDLMYRLMIQRAEVTVYDQSVYAAAAEGITGYLKGELESITVPGQDEPMFHQREMAHLHDVRHLVQLGLFLKWPMLVLSFVSAVMCFFTKPLLKNAAARGMGVGILCFYLALLALIIWVVFDFTNAFSAFHRLLFCNDLWLLDPKTDIMIRLMPEGLFVSYVIEYVKRTFLVHACMMTLAVALLRKNLKEE